MKNLKKKFRFRINLKSKHLLAIMTLFCLSCIVATFASVISTAPLQETAGIVIVPFEKSIEKIGSMVRSVSDSFKDKQDLLFENEELKAELDKIFVKNLGFKNLMITVLSFGFKYGIPSDSDLVFDVRFLPNPYYIDELRPLSGNDKPVSDYVMNCEASRIFLDKLADMVSFLIPNYILEGKNQLVVSIGCTGGKHRSVTLANALYQRLEQSEEYGVRIEHRDIGKDAIRKKMNEVR